MLRFLAIITFAIFGALSALAESAVPGESPINVEDFFPDGNVREVVPREVAFRPSKVTYFKDEAAKAEEAKREAEESVGALNDKPKKSTPLELEAISHQSILKEYGDPDADVPILGDEKAPKPMQALQRALQINDRELATKYAKQFARYLVNTRQRVTDLTGMIQVAMQKEGVVSSTGWSNPKAYEPYQEIFEEIESSKKPLTEEEKVETLARKIMKDEQWLAEAGTGGIEASSGISEKFNEEAARKEVRAELATRAIPRDPAGVAVLAFFRLNARETNQMLTAYNKLSTSTDSRIGFVAHTTETETPVALELFRRATGVKFPIENGAKLARDFKIKKSPTLVFMGVSTGKVHVEEGVREFYYIDELLKVMLGGK